MYLIVGLGNPEEEYSKTRHNMGFDTINKIAKQNNIEINKTGFDGIYGKGNEPICVPGLGFGLGVHWPWRPERGPGNQ